MDKNHFVAVAGMVTNEKDEVLLIKSPLRGWEFPGGMVEPGESLQQALCREIFEESGARVEITGFVGICKNTEKDIVNIDFTCSYIDGELTSSAESIEVGWFAPVQAVAMVENVLTKKRLKNMLLDDGKVKLFSFTKEPFVVAEEEALLAQ